MSSTPRHNDGICATATWARQGVTVAGGNGWGDDLNQLKYPMGIFVDEDRTIYIADTNNARIMKWTEGVRSGQIVAGKLGAGSGTSQLYGPMDVVVDKAGTVYITDTTNNRVQKWNRNAQWGETVINIQHPIGIALDDEGSLYISAFYQSQALIKFPKDEKNGYVIASNLPDLYYLFVNQNRSIYAADMSNGQIVKLDEGKSQISVVIGGFQSFGVARLSLPHSVVVDQAGAVYVAEYGNNHITRWLPGAKSGIVIAGSSSKGYQSDQLALPTDIAFDIDGNLYVADSGNQRVQKFVIDKSSCQ